MFICFTSSGVLYHRPFHFHISIHYYLCGCNHVVFALQVVPKRTNRPGVSTTNRRPRGRGYGGRGGGRGSVPYYAPRARRPFGYVSSFSNMTVVMCLHPAADS